MEEEYLTEVTGQKPYRHYNGRCFQCTLMEANMYVFSNVNVHHIDIVNDLNGNLENKIWWTRNHSLSNKTIKAACYNIKKQLLIVYKNERCMK